MEKWQGWKTCQRSKNSGVVVKSVGSMSDGGERKANDWRADVPKHVGKDSGI